jgi:hypothetical protein
MRDYYWCYHYCYYYYYLKVKVKVPCYKPKRLRGVPGGSGSRIFSTFGTMKVVGILP